VEKALAQGKSRDEIMALEPATFADRGFQQVLPRALGGMHDALRKNRS